MEQTEIPQISPAILAYLGDALYELVIRRYLVVEKGIKKTNRLHQEAVKLVRAEAQAKLARLIEPDLTAEEADVLRRGRNTKTGHVPVNVSPVIYRHSTGWESLIGFLYLTKRHERIEQLIQLGIQRLLLEEGES